jgi:hypothetical protein
VLERELQLASQSLSAVPQLALGERGQLVEQRLNDGRVQDDHRHLEREPGEQNEYKRSRHSTRLSHEAHEPGHEAIASPLEDLQEAREERRADGGADEPALDSVRDEQPGGRFVEPVLLLEDERRVDAQRECRDGGRKVEQADEEDGLSDLQGVVRPALAIITLCTHLASIAQLEYELTSSRPCPRIKVELDERRLDALAVDPRHERELGLVLAVALRLLKGFLVKVALQHIGGRGLVEEWVLANAVEHACLTGNVQFVARDGDVHEVRLERAHSPREGLDEPFPVDRRCRYPGQSVLNSG